MKQHFAENPAAVARSQPSFFFQEMQEVMTHFESIFCYTKPKTRMALEQPAWFPSKPEAQLQSTSHLEAPWLLSTPH